MKSSKRVLSRWYDFSMMKFGKVLSSEVRRYSSEKGRNIALAHFLRKGFFVEALEPKYEIEGGPGEYDLYIKGTS